MPKSGDVDINEAVIGRILNGDGVEADLRDRLERVQAAFGDGLEISTQKGRTRIQASAVTTTRAARLRQARDGALTRAADAARGKSGNG